MKQKERKEKPGFLNKIGKTIKNIFIKIKEYYIKIKQENLPKLIAFTIFIILLGGTMIFIIEQNSAQGMFKRFFDGLWWTVVTITSVGYGDKYPEGDPGKIIAIFIMLIGVVVTSILSGTIASIFVDRKIKEGRGLENINLKEHIVICGWNRNAEAILEGLERVSAEKNPGVVLINEMSPEDYQLLKSNYQKIDLRFSRGDFTQEAILRRGAISEAKSAIILSDTSGMNSMDNSDERTILGTLAIKSINPDINTSAELINPENEQHLKRANVDEIVVNGEFNGFLFANSTYSRGIPILVKEILSFDSKNIIKLKEIPSDMIGKSFSDLLKYYLETQRGIVIGLLVEDRKISFDDLLGDDTSAIDNFIKRKFQEAEIDLKTEEGKEEHILINPEPDRIISETDSAFVIGLNKELRN